MPLEPKDLKVNHVYRAKRPARVGLFPTLINDRQIVWIGGDQVQYDSPTVSNGRHYPFTKLEAFLKWADRDITDELPKGQWAEG